MKRVYTLIVLAAIFIFVLVWGYPIYLSPAPVIPAQPVVEELQTIQLKGETIRVSVADTPSQREQGLSGRAGLAEDEGMLFVFPKDGNYAFWMKDMRFSIDILWISANGSVVYMAQNLSPDTYPENFNPKTLTRYVLELPAGHAKAHMVGIGDEVDF